MKKLSHILFPIEFNDHDKDVVVRVDKFAKDLGAEMEVLHIVENNLPPYQQAEPSGGLEGAALSYMEDFLAGTGISGSPKKTVRSGKVNQELLSYIEETKPDLVVMATKDLGEEGSNHLGGTAYRVLSAGAAPVLTLSHTNHDLKPSKILVPIDVYFGIYDLKKTLYNYFREDPPEVEIMIVVDPNDPDQEKDREKRILKYELGKFKEIGFENIHGKIVANANTAEAITWRAKEGDFDMIVMSTHGRKGLSQFFLGSTTAEVIHTSDVPVFTIKGENHGKGTGYYAENFPI